MYNLRKQHNLKINTTHFIKKSQMVSKLAITQHCLSVMREFQVKPLETLTQAEQEGGKVRNSAELCSICASEN